jgi:hypothetical protein
MGILEQMPYQVNDFCQELSNSGSKTFCKLIKRISAIAYTSQRKSAITKIVYLGK